MSSSGPIDRPPLRRRLLAPTLLSFPSVGFASAAPAALPSCGFASAAPAALPSCGFASAAPSTAPSCGLVSVPSRFITLSSASGGLFASRIPCRRRPALTISPAPASATRCHRSLQGSRCRLVNPGLTAAQSSCRDNNGRRISHTSLPCSSVHETSVQPTVRASVWLRLPTSRRGEGHAATPQLPWTREKGPINPS